MSTDAPALAPSSMRALRGRILRPENATMLLLVTCLVAVSVFFTIKSDVFLTWDTVRNISSSWADLAVLAVPMALLMIAGGVDLSLGANMALTSVLMALAVRDWGWPGWAAILLSLGVGAGVGAFQGLLCGVIGCNPVIITIGGLFGLRAIAQLIKTEEVAPLGTSLDADGLEQSDRIFRVIGSGEFLGLPTLGWVAIAAFVLGGSFLAFTPWGRYIYAIGINRQAAYLSGLPVRMLPFFLYVATGVGASIAGILAASNIQATNSGSLGIQREFYTLIVVLLGGVAWAGGRGKLSGVAVAVIFIATLFHGLTLLDVNSFVQNVILGAALVVAALVDALLVALPGRTLFRRRVAEQLKAQANSPNGGT